MKVKIGTLLVGLALSCAAHADVKYTETMSMTTDGKAAAGAKPSRNTTYLKAGLKRNDQNMSMGPVTMKMVSVSSCPAKKSMRFDADLKIYTSSPLFSDTKKADDTKTPAAKPAPETTGDKKTGKMVMTVDVKKLGVEEIAGRKARHYIIDQKMEPSGCAGKDPMNFKIEIWVADYDMPAFACRSPWMDNAGGAGGQADGGCAMTMEFKGDQAAMNEAYKGLVVKRKMVMGNTVMIFQLTELSEAKLDDALFAPAADWALVTDAEFDKRRNAAMMQSMMGAVSKNGVKDDGDDDNAADNNNAADDNAKKTDDPAPDPAPAGDGGTMGDVTEGDMPAPDDDKDKDKDKPAEPAKPEGKKKNKWKDKLKSPF